MAPTEYHADAVVRLCERDGATTAAVITEIQLRADEDKRFTWPLYVTALRAKLRCPVFLLVVVPEKKIEIWANEVVPLGPPGFLFKPSVLAFPDLPRIVNAAEAKRLPELAVLSALAHPEPEIATTAFSAIRAFPHDDQRLYTDMILAGLPTDLRERMQARMVKDYVYKSEYALKYVGEGMEKGERQGLQSAVLSLASDKLPRVFAKDKAALRRITDTEKLTKLTVALGRATTEEEARVVFDRALRAVQRA